MNKTLKKALILGGIGFAAGLLIGVSVFYITGVKGPNALKITDISPFELLIGGIYGAIAMGCSVFYDIENWSILRATLSHFLLTLLGFYAMACLQRWMKLFDMVFWISTAAFIIVYIIIWLSQYFSWRRQVRRMNLELQAMKQREK
ncbi:MAG: DUF3021 domain-containing protein [Lachnospiraceae bacterium]|nr:DUF3021 domain-containing protein [Lachnospiraceae bacterium]